MSEDTKALIMLAALVTSVAAAYLALVHFYAGIVR